MHSSLVHITWTTADVFFMCWLCVCVCSCVDSTKYIKWCILYTVYYTFVGSISNQYGRWRPSGAYEENVFRTRTHAHARQSNEAVTSAYILYFQRDAQACRGLCIFAWVCAMRLLVQVFVVIWFEILLFSWMKWKIRTFEWLWRWGWVRKENFHERWICILWKFSPRI